METTYNSMLRSMLNIKIKERIEIKEIGRRMKNARNFLHEIRRRKWDWAGQVVRMQDDRWTNRITNWYIGEKRKRGRRKMRWTDGITEYSY